MECFLGFKRWYPSVLGSELCVITVNEQARNRKTVLRVYMVFVKGFNN